MVVKYAAPSRSYGGVSAADRVADRRERLLEAGLEEFGTRGTPATGVKDVCARAGLTTRYFYESFDGRDALFVAVFDRATERMFALVAEAVAQAEPSARAQIRAAIEAFVRALADDPRIARVVFVEAAGAGPEVERHMRATLRSFAALVAATARALVPPAVPDATLHFASIACVGAIERVMIEWQEGELGMDIDAIIDSLVDALVGGLRLTARSGS